MSPKLVKMTFDFDNNIISLVGLTDEPIQYTLETCNSYHNEYNMNYYVEYSLGKNKNKWIFKWNQYNQREQSFSVEQYISFPQDYNIIVPYNYEPWSILARWSYIANPSVGTLQTNKILKHFYHHDLVDKYDIQFEVKGKPAIANWSTQYSQPLH